MSQMKKQRGLQTQKQVQVPDGIVGGGKTYKLMKGDRTKPRSEGERWRAVFELGLIEMGKGEDEKALAYFEELWAQNPTGKRRDELIRWLGLARWGAAYGREATPILEEAYKKQPWDKDVGVFYASALQNIGKLDEAEQVARDLLKLDRKDIRSVTLLCDILARRRKYEEASKLLYEADEKGLNSIRLAMAFGVIAMKSKQEQAAVEWIERELNDPKLGVSSRMSACFSLGDLYDKIGDYEKAFKFYHEGNKLRDSTFEIKKSRNKREVAMKIWTPERIKRLREFGDPDKRPVLIVGMPRSGTTLTEQVLGRHEKIYPAGELRMVRAIPEKIQSLFAGSASVHTIATAFDSLTPGQLKRAAQIYIDHIDKLAGPEYERVIDKMPGNIWHCGMLASLLPGARFIFSRRDPRDICFSCYFRNFRQEHGYSTDLNVCGEYCREVFLMAEYWQETLNEAAGEEIFINSTYENLVSDPHTYGKQLFDHVGMPWDDSMVDIDQDQRNVATLRTDQMGRKIDTKSKERWRRYEKYVQPIEEGLGDVLPYEP